MKKIILILSLFLLISCDNDDVACLNSVKTFFPGSDIREISMHEYLVFAKDSVANGDNEIGGGVYIVKTMNMGNNKISSYQRIK